MSRRNWDAGNCLALSSLLSASAFFFNLDFAFLPSPNFPLTTGVSLHTLGNANETNNICNTKDRRTDVCEIIGDVRIDTNSASVLLVTSNRDINMSWAIRPYPRKEDPIAMISVKEWSVKSAVSEISDIPQCNQTHEVPAILFSTGGYSGNNFHDFSDILIPLFITARKFNGKVKLLITDDGHSWWNVKFHKFLKKLSNYELIKTDKEKVVHCFQSAILGLKRYPGELMIDSSRSPHTMEDFKTFLRNSYSLPKVSAIVLGQSEKQSPLLLIIARKASRAFTNTQEIKDMAEELGFKVVIAEPRDPKNLSEFAGIVNSCDVMMGVHGAGLANMVFLPENAVMIQVVPIGLEWFSKDSFENPSKDMGVKYLEYKIEIEESSLIEQFPPGHVVLSDPDFILKEGWGNFSSIYLSKQKIKVNVNRLRPTLFKALELLHQ